MNENHSEGARAYLNSVDGDGENNLETQRHVILLALVAPVRRSDLRRLTVPVQRPVQGCNALDIVWRAFLEYFMKFTRLNTHQLRMGSSNAPVRMLYLHAGVLKVFLDLRIVRELVFQNFTNPHASWHETIESESAPQCAQN